MKRCISRLGMLVVFIGCGVNPFTSNSLAAQTPPPVVLPSVDYSRIGPNDSAIIVYPDPELKRWDLLKVTLDPGGITTGEMGRKATQIQVPNGTYSIYISARSLFGGGHFRRMPFNIALDNVAITYKIRLATNEEKTAAGIGIGNIVYTLDEVSQTILR